MSAPALRPRSVTELVDAAFQLVRLHYLQFVSIAAVFLIPAILIQAVLVRVPTVPGPVMAPGLVFAFIPIGLLGLLGTAAVVVAVSDSYVHDRVDVGQAVQRVLARIGPIIGGAMGQGLVLFLAALVLGVAAALIVGALSLALPRGAAAISISLLVFPIFIVGGIAVFARIFAVPMVIVLEGTSVSQAFSRSIELTRGSVWRVIGVLVLTGVIFLALFGAFLFLLTYVSAVAPRGGPIYNVLSSVLQIFAYPIYTVFITLLYYDLRIRKDGYDLEVMTKELTGSAPSVSA